MKNRIKDRLISILLVIALTITIIPLSAKPAEAASVSQAYAVIAAGEMFVGLSREGMKAKMREFGTDPYYASWNGEWCQWFVSNCGVQALVPSSVIYRSLQNDRTFWKNRGRYKSRGSGYVPQPGDIIYFNYEGKDWAEHTGIVRYVKGDRVYTVEGNSENKVRFKDYNYKQNTNILGYGHPDYRNIDIGYVIKYNANGGKGSMKDSKVKTYGDHVTLRNNKFTRKGYVFMGWNVHRKSDGCWWYTNGKKHGWYEKGDQPSGWTMGVWSNKKTIIGNSTYINNDVITCYAKWVRESEIENSKIWTRLSGLNKYETMQRIVFNGFTKKRGTMIVALGTGFADALSASGYAGLYDAPIILTDGRSLTSNAQVLLQKFKPREVIIIGGKLAISNGVKNQIQQITGVTPIRIGGNDSAGTSAKLAVKGKGKWSQDDIAVIATNASFKDALSIAPIAYYKKYPILLATKGRSLSDDVISALTRLKTKEVIIVGGKKAVSSNVEKQLTDMGITIKERLAGDTGIETSREIAKWGLANGMKANKMGVATSVNYPDALAGAAFCGHFGSVLILADDDNIANASFPKAYKDAIKKGYIFGGQAAVGLKTYKKLDQSTS